VQKQSRDDVAVDCRGFCAGVKTVSGPNLPRSAVLTNCRHARTGSWVGELGVDSSRGTAAAAEGALGGAGAFGGGVHVGERGWAGCAQQ
jgi:hypothetical protein